jgi:hypothetical protein
MTGNTLMVDANISADMANGAKYYVTDVQIDLTVTGTDHTSFITVYDNTTGTIRLPYVRLRSLKTGFWSFHFDTPILFTKGIPVYLAAGTVTVDAMSYIISGFAEKF